MLLILGHTHTLTHTLHDSLPPHTTAPFCKASAQIRVCICPPSLAANSTVTKLISSIWFWHVFSLACVVFHVVCEKCAFDFFSLMTMLTNYCHWDSEEFLWDHSRVYLHPLYKFSQMLDVFSSWFHWFTTAWGLNISQIPQNLENLTEYAFNRTYCFFPGLLFF